MIAKTQILIVEDNVLIADDMQAMLETMGYVVVANVGSYEAAIVALSEHDIDLALLDMELATEKTGLDVGVHIREKYNIPFLFITSYASPEMVASVKKVKPNGYLVKPFEEKDLFASIEVSMLNFEQISVKEQQETDVVKDFIFVKEGYLFKKILFNEIYHIKSDNVYIDIYTKGKKYVVRSTLKDFLTKLPPQDFYRISKSYIVNVNEIQALNSRDVIVNEQMLPITKDYREALKKRLDL